MPDKLGTFDAEAFYEALDATREARRLTWKEVAGLAGISASTLTRMAQGRRPDVDSLSALASWSGLVVDDFVRSDVRRPQVEPLAAISTLLKGDRNLSVESAEALDKILRAAYKQLRDAK